MKTPLASIAVTFALAGSLLAAGASASGAQAVPEPSVISLLAGAGLLSTAFFLRRRRR